MLFSHTLSFALAFVFALVLAVPSADARPKNKEKTVEVVNLNLLHGFACDPPVPADGDQCRVRDRVDLLVQHIIAVGCPDVVTLQENVVNEFVQTGATTTAGPLDSTVELIEARLGNLAASCGFLYEVVFDPEGLVPGGAPRGVDEELILTRYPALEAETTIVYGILEPFFNRRVLRARIDHPVGPVDVYTTHLASGADFATVPCGTQFVFPAPCPAECEAFVDTVRECQAKQLALHVEATHDVHTPAFITGDFNALPTSSEYAEMVSRGWIDSHLEAGQGECNSTTGENCTSGRSEEGGDLEDPALNTDRRIDYIFVVPPADDVKCDGALGVFDDEKGPVTSTGLFAHEPNPFAPECGPSPLPICFTSDHSGNAVHLSCQRR